MKVKVTEATTQRKDGSFEKKEFPIHDLVSSKSAKQGFSDTVLGDEDDLIDCQVNLLTSHYLQILTHKCSQLTRGGLGRCGAAIVHRAMGITISGKDVRNRCRRVDKFLGPDIANLFKKVAKQLPPHMVSKFHNGVLCGWDNSNTICQCIANNPLLGVICPVCGGQDGPLSVAAMVQLCTAFLEQSVRLKAADCEPAAMMTRSGGAKCNSSSFEPVSRHDDASIEEEEDEEEVEEDCSEDEEYVPVYNGKTQSRLQITESTVGIETSRAGIVGFESERVAPIRFESANAQTALESPSGCDEEDGEEEEENESTDTVNLTKSSPTTPLKGVLKNRYLSPPPPHRVSTPQSGDSVHSSISPLKEDATDDDIVVYRQLQSAQKQKKYLNETASKEDLAGKLEVLRKLPSTPVRKRETVAAPRIRIGDTQHVRTYEMSKDYTYSRRELFEHFSDALRKAVEELFAHTLTRYGGSLETAELQERSLSELHHVSEGSGVTAEQAQQRALMVFLQLEELVQNGLPRNCGVNCAEYCRQRLAFIVYFESALYFIGLSLVVSCDLCLPMARGAKRLEPLDVARKRLLPGLGAVVRDSELGGVNDVFHALRDGPLQNLLTHVKKRGFYDLHEAPPLSPVSASGPNCVTSATIADQTLPMHCAWRIQKSVSSSHVISVHEEEEEEMDGEGEIDDPGDVSDMSLSGLALGGQDGFVRPVRAECADFSEALKTALSARLAVQCLVDKGCEIDINVIRHDLSVLDEECEELIVVAFNKIAEMMDRELSPSGDYEMDAVAREVRDLAVSVGLTHPAAFHRNQAWLLGRHAPHHTMAILARLGPAQKVRSVDTVCGSAVRDLVQMSRVLYSDETITPTPEQLDTLSAVCEAARKSVEKAYMEQLGLGESGDFVGVSEQLLEMVVNGVRSLGEEQSWDEWFGGFLQLGFME